jgi:hypothetical protein
MLIFIKELFSVLLLQKWPHQRTVQSARKGQELTFVLDARDTFAKETINIIEKRWLMN